MTGERRTGDSSSRRWNRTCDSLLNVHVRPESDVVGQIPADVFWIRIDRDLIGVPEPIVAEPQIGWRHIKEEAAKPEAAGTASFEPKEIARRETTLETTVLPWMIEVVMHVATTGVMANPVTIRMHVRRIRMSLAVTE
jgi:hypothetical protein